MPSSGICHKSINLTHIGCGMTYVGDKLSFYGPWMVTIGEKGNRNVNFPKYLVMRVSRGEKINRSIVRVFVAEKNHCCHRVENNGRSFPQIRLTASL